MCHVEDEQKLKVSVQVVSLVMVRADILYKGIVAPEDKNKNTK